MPKQQSAKMQKNLSAKMNEAASRAAAARAQGRNPACSM